MSVLWVLFVPNLMYHPHVCCLLGYRACYQVRAESLSSSLAALRRGGLNAVALRYRLGMLHWQRGYSVSLVLAKTLDTALCDICIHGFHTHSLVPSRHGLDTLPKHPYTCGD